MKTEKTSRIFLYYVRQNLFTLFMFLSFVVIVALIFYFYDLPLEAVAYSGALCALLCAIVLPVRFYAFLKRHKRNVIVLSNPRLMLDELPEPKTLLEHDMRLMLDSMKKDLEDAIDDRALDREESIDFYTTWAHQIKTPISVMRMILEEDDTEERRELLAELFRIEQYVEMVLTYLRLESESSDYVFADCDIDGVIRQAIHRYAPLFVRRKISLTYEPTHKRVLTDEKWLLFIIEQVLSNSTKYTYKGSVTITFTDENVLRISDTGIGIAAEDLPRIFEKGFTGYNGRSFKKSTGLGLYLCKRAAQKLGHGIYAESTVGEGTTISIDLNTERFSLE